MPKTIVLLVKAETKSNRLMSFIIKKTGRPKEEISHGFKKRS